MYQHGQVQHLLPTGPGLATLSSVMQCYAVLWVVSGNLQTIQLCFDKVLRYLWGIVY